MKQPITKESVREEPTSSLIVFIAYNLARCAPDALGLGGLLMESRAHLLAGSSDFVLACEELDRRIPVPAKEMP